MIKALHEAELRRLEMHRSATKFKRNLDMIKALHKAELRRLEMHRSVKVKPAKLTHDLQWSNQDIQSELSNKEFFRSSMMKQLQSSKEAVVQSMREQYQSEQQRLQIELESAQIDRELIKILQKMQEIGQILGPGKFPKWFDCCRDHSMGLTPHYSLPGSDCPVDAFEDANVTLWLQYGVIEQFCELLGQAQILAQRIVDEYCSKWDEVVEGKLPQSFCTIEDISLRSSLQIWFQIDYVWPLDGLWEFMAQTHVCLYLHQKRDSDKSDHLRMARENPHALSKRRGIRFQYDFTKSVCFYEKEGCTYTGSVQVRQVQGRLYIGAELDSLIVELESDLSDISSELLQVHHAFSSTALRLGWKEFGDVNALKKLDNPVANELKFETRAPGDRSGIGFDADRTSVSSRVNKDFQKGNRVSKGEINLTFIPFPTLRVDWEIRILKNKARQLLHDDRHFNTRYWL
jgi:hypothetical protein